ncbi:MAG: isoprenylcysteine carboxylmethyltransferase family protein [Chloroflexi bacterium]|jgi:protein-S-isoprenylcysteine O-methyltransferase Ste14|nr:isoprenylcysteine carboxylmethyltransferase family protein [Chloroflexota bacterium]
MSRLPDLGPRGEGWVAIQGVLFVVIAASAFLPPAWEGALRVATVATGAALIVLGGILAVRGQRDLGRSLTVFPRPRGDATLIEAGVYARVRHPIYGGLVLAAFGWGLVGASPVGLALAAVLLGFFALKSTREEAWLADRFPGYPAYRARTKRFVPFVI